jgi:hypothetical protein
MEISRNKQGDVIYEFIQLLLDIHRLTDFAICKEDDKILSFISQNLKDNSEIQNIDNISFDVYLPEFIPHFMTTFYPFFYY